MQTTYLNTVTLSEFTDLVEKNYLVQQNLVKPVAQQMFITENIAKGTGNSKRFDEVDTKTYAKRKREGVKTSKASVGVGYSKTMYKKRIGIEIDITQEMRDENKNNQIVGQLTSLAHYCPQRIDLDLTHILTFATATSYVNMDGETVDLTTGDGLALAYSAHTLKFSSTTYRNRIASDPLFSKGGLQAAELLTTTDILSNFGEKRVMNFNVIFSGDDPSTMEDIKQFISSTSDNTQNNAGVVNTYKGKYRHVVLPNLATTASGANDSTKRKWWGIAAIGQGILGWQAYHGVWEASHMKAPSEDSSADVWTYGTRAGYGQAAISGRGIIFSCPTS